MLTCLRIGIFAFQAFVNKLANIFARGIGESWDSFKTFVFLTLSSVRISIGQF